MEEDVLKKYLEAGRIASRVLEEALKLIDVGVKLIDICSWVEKRIRELGGQPAFPCNISVNEVAAHYTPLVGDEQVVPEGAVVKLDVGVHVDGFIADTAATVSLDPRYEPLLDAVREALERALEAAVPGTRFSSIGRVIEDVIKSYSFKPVVNLCGHSLGRYLIHAGESIPNFYDPSARGVLEPGKAYAIEPFATNGEGRVRESNLVTIYAAVRPYAKRLDERSRALLQTIYERFRTLPFTERWLVDVCPDVSDLRRRLERMSRMGVLIRYPVLVEVSGGLVAQFEHTIVVLKDQIVVVTKR